MIVYEKDGKQYPAAGQQRRGVMKITTDTLDKQDA